MPAKSVLGKGFEVKIDDRRWIYIQGALLVG